MTRKFSETVAARIAVDHEFTKALLAETETELGDAHSALRQARESLRMWNMDTSFIDEIVGTDGFVEPKFTAELGAC